MYQSAVTTNLNEVSWRGAEIQGNKSPEEAVRKFTVGFMKLMGVLRLRHRTFDEYPRSSLSKADRTEPVGGDKQEAGHYAYQDDRILDVYICVCSFPVYTP